MSQSRSLVPRYHQIYLILRQGILEGVYDQDGLPGEIQLAQQYQAARVTIRRAILGLVKEGLVSRCAGRGTFVDPEYAGRTGSSLRAGGLLDSIVSAAAKTNVQVVEFGYCPCPTDVAAALCVNPHDQVLRVLRVRSHGENPVSFVTTYLPAYIGALLKAGSLGQKPMLTLLQEQGIKLGDATQTLSACLADALTGELLQEHVGAPLLSVVRVIRDTDGRPIQWLKGLYRPEHYEYRMVLSGGGGDASRVWVTDGSGAANQ